jgi:phosphoglycerol transferase MdoB-like AlkP superfamily enzyme
MPAVSTLPDAPLAAPVVAAAERRGPEDWLVLASAGLALIMVSITALAYVSLRHNPWIVFYLVFDALIVLYFTVALAILQRRRTLGTVLALILSNAILAASCTKTWVLGEPGQFADVNLLPDLLRVTKPILAWLAIAAVAIPVLAYLANLGLPRTAREALLLLPLAGAILFMTCVATAPRLAHAVVGATPVKGRPFPILGHFYTAYATLVKDADWLHTVHQLRLDGTLELPITALPHADLTSIARRNLHILVLESFTDPAWYPHFGLDDAPVPPLFERWRREAGSTALSPVFGNRSPNAEFEVLCGVPAAAGPSDVIFWRLPPKASLSCLPNLLGEQGYRSTALHPSPRRTFNLSEAYPALGFDQSAFIDDLDTRDRDGGFLSAASTLDQHWARVAPLLAGDRPVLSYIFVNASHFPYDRDEARRPTRWHPAGASEQVTAYMNAIHYLMVAVNGFVERLRRQDPDSLIVIVGDHAPALGPNFQGQREGGRIAPDEPNPLGRADMYEVPLIMLDRGEMVPLGRLPTYLVPYAILDRLGACGERHCGWDTAWRLRPFRDHAILVERNGDREQPCSVSKPDQACEPTARQARAWQLQLLELIEGPPDRAALDLATEPAALRVNALARGLVEQMDRAGVRRQVDPVARAELVPLLEHHRDLLTRHAGEHQNLGAGRLDHHDLRGQAGAAVGQVEMLRPNAVDHLLTILAAGIPG